MILGTGPKPVGFPFYPTFLVLSDLRLFRADGLSNPYDHKIEQFYLDQLFLEGKIWKFEPIEQKENLWPVFIGKHDIAWYGPDKVEKLQQEHAKNLFDQGQNLIKTDPLLALKFIRQSSYCINQDIDDIFKQTKIEQK